MPRVERDRAYWKEYARRKCYATVKVDASRTAIGDLSVFCNLLFPFNPRRARVAEALLREMSRLRTRKIELSKVAAEICRREKCSARTLAQAWLSLLNSGLLRRSRRNEPAQLSEVFAERLEAIARYWREMVREIPKGELAR